MDVASGRSARYDCRRSPACSDSTESNGRVAVATADMLRVRSMAGFEDAVIGVLRGLRPGEVVTYGEVAEEAGYPGAARAVGNVLARSDGLPWWRVVTSTGRLVGGHEHEQARRLRSEGVEVAGRRVRPRFRAQARPSE